MCTGVLHACMSVHRVCVQRHQRPERTPESRRLELKTAADAMWMMRIKAGSSERAASALNQSHFSHSWVYLRQSSGENISLWHLLLTVCLCQHVNSTEKEQVHTSLMRCHRSAWVCCFFDVSTGWRADWFSTPEPGTGSHHSGDVLCLDVILKLPWSTEEIEEA